MKQGERISGIPSILKTSILPQGAVSVKFREGARRLGLAQPLIGLHDERLLDPETLLAAGWQKGEFSERNRPHKQWVAYSFRGNREFDIQRYSKVNDGSEILTTSMIQQSKDHDYLFVTELITKAPDGTITYATEEFPLKSY